MDFLFVDSPLFGYRNAVFCLKLPQGLYYMSVNSKGSEEPVHKPRLA